MIRTPLSACAIALLFLLQVQVTNIAFRDGIQFWHTSIMIASGGMQSAALYVLYRSLQGSSPTRAATIVLTCAALAMAVLSLWSKNTSIDASAYVGYARLPNFARAYTSAPETPAEAGFEPIARSWGPRLPPLVYGPLWLLIDRLELAHARSYGEALFVVRIAALATLVGLVLALRGLAARPEELAAIALNPGLYYYYVVQAHNDLTAIFLIVAGMAIAARRPLLGAAVAGAAGLIKIVFACFAALALDAKSPRRITYEQLALMLALVAAGSLLFGGSGYVHAMWAVAMHQYGVRHDAIHRVELALRVVLASLAIASVAAAAFRGVFFRLSPFTFFGLGAIVYPWYLGWGIPYAARIGSPSLLIAFPAIAHFIDPAYPLYPARTFAGVGMLELGVLAAAIPVLLRHSRRAD